MQFVEISITNCFLLCSAQHSAAAVAGSSAVMESVFHEGMSVTMTMTVETEVMSRTAVRTSQFSLLILNNFSSVWNKQYSVPRFSKCYPLITV